jgi:hypothetical protein
MMRLVPAFLLLGLASAQAQYNGYQCPMSYKACNGKGKQGDCCDVDTDCACDQYCPNHPEVWTKGGCAVPKSRNGVVKRGDFVCPVGYHKCTGRHHCCDIEPDCKCDNKCDKQMPKGFDCTLTPGQDEYSAVSDGAICPGGYTECSRFCDLNPDCKQDSKCVAKPSPGFRCIVPKRKNGDKTKMQGGRIEAFATPMAFDDAQKSCKAMEGQLLSIHSSADWFAMKRAVTRARITSAVLIGGYETGKAPHEIWHWIDGTVMDKHILSSLQSQTFGDNFGTNENQMAYCSSQCVSKLLGGTAACPNCEGLHDWGNKGKKEFEGIGGYVCRLKAGFVGHVVDHRDPTSPTIYQEDGAMVATIDANGHATPSNKKSTGWSNNEITNVGSAGTAHGPWGKATTTVTRLVPIPKGYTECTVSWRSWAIDSRDGEQDELWINDKRVWAQKAQMAFTPQADGSSCMLGWKQVRGYRYQPAARCALMHASVNTLCIHECFCEHLAAL